MATDAVNSSDTVKLVVHANRCQPGITAINEQYKKENLLPKHAHAQDSRTNKLYSTTTHVQNLVTSVQRKD